MNNSKPKLSIITVVKNAENVLEETINSIIYQTFKDFEFIIFDGNSTDKTVSIIKKYEKDITLWKSESDKGVYDAMNRAVSLASGDWIIFMNAGDVFTESNVLEIVFNENLMDVDFIYGNHYFLFRSGRMVPVYAKPLEFLWKEMAFSHQSLFVRRNLIEKYKFDLTFKIAADFNHILHLFYNNHKYLHINEFITIYSGDGISVKNQIKSLFECWSAVQKFEKSNFLKLNIYYLKKIIERYWILFKRQIINNVRTKNAKRGKVYNAVQSEHNIKKLRIKYPFLINKNFFSNANKVAISSLFKCLISEKIKMKYLKFENKDVFCGTIKTKEFTTQIFSSFIKVHEAFNCYKIKCFMKSDGSQCFKAMQIRFFDEFHNRLNVPVFKYLKDKGSAFIQNELAYNFFISKDEFDWLLIEAKILKESNEATDNMADGYYIKLTDNVRYFKIGFICNKNEGETNLYFYSPIIEEFCSS